MEVGRIFGRYIVVKNGKELNPQELAEFEEIRKQVGDDYGDWKPVTLPSKPEGTRALRRVTSEITEYLFVKHPAQDEKQIIEGYYISTAESEDAIIRYEVVKFPDWYENEIYTA
jgi:hypothetical protein